MGKQSLRIILFTMVAEVPTVMRDWAKTNGHEIVLTVTTPGSRRRRNKTYLELVEAAPRQQDILVTTRMRGVARPLVEALKPDLILSWGFPFLIPAEVYSIATIGAVNLHPAPLPLYRGPNAPRHHYDGWPEIGSTLHWLSEDFDTGHILRQIGLTQTRQVCPGRYVERMGANHAKCPLQWSAQGNRW